MQLVIAFTARQRVGPGAAVQHIIAEIAADLIGTSTAKATIIAFAQANDIVVQGAADLETLKVDKGTAGRGSGEQSSRDCIKGQGRALVFGIGLADTQHVNAAAAIQIVAPIGLRNPVVASEAADLVAAATGRNRIFQRAAPDRIAGIAGVDLHSLEIRKTGADDPIDNHRPGPVRKMRDDPDRLAGGQIGHPSEMHDDRIEPNAAVGRILQRLQAKVDHIIAGLPHLRILIEAAVDRVVSGAAKDGISPRQAKDRIVAGVILRTVREDIVRGSQIELGHPEVPSPR